MTLKGVHEGHAKQAHNLQKQKVPPWVAEFGCYVTWVSVQLLLRNKK